MIQPKAGPISVANCVLCERIWRGWCTHVWGSNYYKITCVNCGALCWKVYSKFFIFHIYLFFTRREKRSIRLHVGAVQIASGNQSKVKSELTYEVEDIFIHPKRDTYLKVNDLAIIKVLVPFNFSRNVKPICIGNITVDRMHANETVKVLKNIYYIRCFKH